MKKREKKNVLLSGTTKLQLTVDRALHAPFFPPLPRRRKVVFYSNSLNVTMLRQSACRSSSMRLNPKCAERKKTVKQTRQGVGGFFESVAEKKAVAKKLSGSFSSCRFFCKVRKNVFFVFFKAGNKKKQENGPKKLSNLAVKYNDVIFVSRRDSWYVYSSGSL